MDLLDRLEKDPYHPALRLECAELLTRQGDPRGEFLSLDSDLARRPCTQPEFKRDQARLDDLARALEAAWVARVGALSARRSSLWRRAWFGLPALLLAEGLRPADLGGLLRADREIRVCPHATGLQLFRWALPGPVLEVAVHAGPRELQAWVPRSYWATSPSPVEDDGAYSVVLLAPGPDRLATLRLIREVTGLDLRSAKARLDQLPGPVVLAEAVSRVESRQIAHQASALGCRVEVLIQGSGQAGEPDLLTAGVSLLEGGDPGLVALRATAEHLEVRDFAIRWTGPHQNQRAHPLRQRWRWDELPADPVARLALVRPVVEAAVAARRATFRPCRYCQEPTPPEWQHSQDVCSGCAEKHLGVVH